MAQNKTGFTLIELIIVLIIIGVLSSIGVPIIKNTSEKAKWSECVNTLGAIRTALKIYQIERGDFPNPGGTVLNYTTENQQACQGLLGITIDLPKTGPDGSKYFVYVLYTYDQHRDYGGAMAYGFLDKNNNGGWNGDEPYIRIYDNGTFSSFDAPDF